jgi:hypothetical protein
MPAKGSSSGRLSGSRGGSGSGAARGGGRHASSNPPKRGGSTSRGKHQAPSGAEKIKGGRYKVQSKQNPFLMNDNGMLRAPSAATKRAASRPKQDAARKAGKNPFMLEGPKKSIPKKKGR